MSRPRYYCCSVKPHESGPINATDKCSTLHEASDALSSSHTAISSPSTEPATTLPCHKHIRHPQSPRMAPTNLVPAFSQCRSQSLLELKHAYVLPLWVRLQSLLLLVTAKLADTMNASLYFDVYSPKSHHRRRSSFAHSSTKMV